MDFFPVIEKGNQSGNSNPDEYSGSADCLKIRNGPCGRQIEEYNGNRCKADDFVGKIPGIFVPYRPGETEPGVAGKREAWGKSLRKTK